MLFDLSSTRRRRTTVRFIYGTLAVLIAGGLVVLGVGTGSGGGLSSSLNNGGSSGNGSQNAEIAAAVKSAEAKVSASPNSAAAWNALIQARWEQAGSTQNYNSTAETYTAGGKAALKQMLTAYTKYTALLKGTPSAASTFQAAHAYTVTGNYAGATGAWQDFLKASPGALKGFECLAYNAYAAKYTTLAGEAAAKAIALTPKLQQLTVKSDFKQVSGSKTVAQEAALADC
jgi:hypothetical protein